MWGKQRRVVSIQRLARSQDKPVLQNVCDELQVWNHISRGWLRHFNLGGEGNDILRPATPPSSSFLSFVHLYLSDFTSKNIMIKDA